VAVLNLVNLKMAAVLRALLVAPVLAAAEEAAEVERKVEAVRDLLQNLIKERKIRKRKLKMKEIFIMT